MSATHGDGGFAPAGDFKTPSLDELLRISITLSDKEKLHEAALQDSPGIALSEEDKAWLLESMGAVDGKPGKSDADRMREAIAAVNKSAEPLHHKEYSLDLILFCIEDIDNALDFIKIEGGLQTLVDLLASDQPSLRLGGAWILGTLVQNNPKAQHAVFETGCLSTLLGLIKTDTVVDVRRKALLAVSALVRGFSLAADRFIEQENGFVFLANLVNSGRDQADGMTSLVDPTIQKRALFLLTHLLREEPSRTTAARQAKLVASVGGMLVAAGSGFDGETMEMALGLLLLLVENDTTATAQMDAVEGLMQFIVTRRGEIVAMEGEERQWASEELRLCEAITTLSST